MRRSTSCCRVAPPPACPESSTPGCRSIRRSTAATRSIPFRPRGFAPPRRLAPKQGCGHVAARCQQGFTAPRPVRPKPTPPSTGAHPGDLRTTSDRIDRVPTEAIGSTVVVPAGPHAEARAPLLPDQAPNIAQSLRPTTRIVRNQLGDARAVPARPPRADPAPVVPRLRDPAARTPGKRPNVRRRPKSPPPHTSRSRPRGRFRHHGPPVVAARRSGRPNHQFPHAGTGLRSSCRPVARRVGLARRPDFRRCGPA